MRGEGLKGRGRGGLSSPLLERQLRLARAPAAASPKQTGETDAHQGDASRFWNGTRRSGADGACAGVEVGNECRAIQNVIVHVTYFELDRVRARGKN